MILLAAEALWLLLLPPLLLLWSKKRLTRANALLFGSYVLLVVAMSQPALEAKPKEVEEYLSDVVIAVDLSYSMQAADLLPTRLEVAKEQLKKIVKSNIPSRFGVVGFTTNAIILSPLSRDSELLLHLFEGLDSNKIMTKGSAIMPALALARKLSKSKTLTVVLLSDGADEPSYAKEAAFAKESALRVNLLMLATPMGSSIKMPDGSLLKDEAGNIVISRANDAIQALPHATNGVSTKDVAEMIEALRAQREEEFLAQSIVHDYHHLHFYFITLSIVLLVLHFTTLGKKIFRYFGTFLLLFGVEIQAFDAYKNLLAKEAYRSSNYERAAELFMALEGPHARFNEANSYYKAGEYEKALALYASIRSNDAHLKAMIFYNLANSFVRLKEFEKARDAFKKSLLLEYSSEAMENYLAILDAKDPPQMITGNQDSKEQSPSASEQDSSKKEQKEGGSSNMQVSAQSGAGEDGGKKNSQSSALNFGEQKAQLSSRQYELINERQSSEKQPW